MDAAYDDQVYVDDRTIDSHIKRLRKKFKVGRRRFRHDRDALRRRLPLQGSLSPAGPGCAPALTASSRCGQASDCGRLNSWSDATACIGCSSRAKTTGRGRDSVLDRTKELTPQIPPPNARPARNRARVRPKRRCSGFAGYWQYLHRPGLFEPDAPHRLPQHRGPVRAGHRHSVSVAIRAGSSSTRACAACGAGRNHRRRDRGIGHGRNQFHHDRSATACSNCSSARRYGPDESASGLEFPINPERVAPVLRRLISPTNTRARIYDRDGVLLLDSRNLYGRGDVLRFDLPPPQLDEARLFRAHWIRSANGSRAAICRSTSELDARKRQGLSGSGVRR